MLYLTIAIVLVVLVGGVLARLVLGARLPKSDEGSAGTSSDKKPRFFIFGKPGGAGGLPAGLLRSRLEQPEQGQPKANSSDAKTEAKK